jgi:hypothetical protein
MGVAARATESNQPALALPPPQQMPLTLLANRGLPDSTSGALSINNAGQVVGYSAVRLGTYATSGGGRVSTREACRAIR